MEFCGGGTLQNCIKQTRRRTGLQYTPPDLALCWVGQIFLGLEHLHLRIGILHRDLKPESIVLTDKKCAKLTDFTCGCFDTESDRNRSFQPPPGSWGYVASELILGQRCDFRADLYSFGVIIWMLYSGGLFNCGEPGPPHCPVAARHSELLMHCITEPEGHGAFPILWNFEILKFWNFENLKF